MKARVKLASTNAKQLGKNNHITWWHAQNSEFHAFLEVTTRIRRGQHTYHFSLNGMDKLSIVGIGIRPFPHFIIIPVIKWKGL